MSDVNKQLLRMAKSVLQDAQEGRAAINISLLSMLRHSISEAEQAQQAEPVAWQFYQDGKWWNGYGRIKDHRKNTEDAGIPTRDLYAKPPAVANEYSDVTAMLLDSAVVICAQTGNDLREWATWLSNGGMLEMVMAHTEKALGKTRPPAVVVPDGYALVPIEPTREMFKAVDKLDDEMFAGGCAHGANFEQLWEAAIFAAPKP